MKKIEVTHGFHPQDPREYQGEYIYKVIQRRQHNGTDYFCVENGVWIRALGSERYISDWTAEERWGRVIEVEYGDDGTSLASKDLGFMILRVDRARGLL